MFGEDDSESPRVASPWDPFLASPSSRSVSSLELSSSLASCTPGSPPTFPRGIPKLVPEAEQGNIEYKLKLINPTPARFARLVTQLKWRLLEGGGQACYELGVTDDGLLIGLSRGHLEQSLETLEMMAGEIGASVVVVKEIEVPRALTGLNEKFAAKYIDFDTGEVRRADSRSSSSPLPPGDFIASTASTSTESDSEQDSTSDAIFSVDPEVETKRSPPTIDLEISSVYKPRPMRARASFLTAHTETIKHRGHHGKKKHKQRHGIASYIIPTPDPSPPLMVTTIPTKQQTKQAWRQQAKDRRNDARRAASHTTQDTVQNAADALIPALHGLHVSIVPSSTLPVDNDTQAAAAQSASVDDGPRFIVEALVVRKLSLEEAFLDFGGFG